MIKCLSLNPSLDKSLVLNKLVAWDINRVNTSRLDVGSKGINVTRAIKVLGGKSEVWGFSAGYVGRHIKFILTSLRISHRFIPVEGENRLIINIFETSTGRELRFNEPGPFVPGPGYRKFITALFNSLAPADFLSISGSLPRGLCDRTYGEVIKRSKKTGCKVFLDSDNAPLKYGIEAGPYLVKLNRFELKRWANSPVNTLSQIEKAGRRILDCGVEVVVVSGGKKEVVCLSREETLIAIPPCVKVRSSVGAGDAMLAGLIFDLARGGNLSNALRLGTACGSAKARTPGTSMPSKKDIMRLLGLVELKKKW